MTEHGKILLFDSLDPSPAPSCTVEADCLPARSPDEVLAELLHILRECGQDPVTQLVGYLTTEDPTYLPDCDHARLLANRVGRDKLLTTLIETYLNHTSAKEGNFTP